MQGRLTSTWNAKQTTPPLSGEVPKAEGSQNINNLPYLKTFRKQLRNNLTQAEAKLWTLIKGKQLEGRKFRRQFSVAKYILDFYCPSENLAIELDGQGHFESAQADYDRERDLFLKHCGIKVLRFENKLVWNNPEEVLNEVKSSFGWVKDDPSVLRTAPLKGEQLENAGELLAKIKAEKELLIKQKKIKKPKPLPPISEDEIPFEIPKNWVWCRLGEISQVNPRNNLNDDLKVGFCPMPLIYSEYGKNVDFETKKWKEIKSGFTHFSNNDVVLAKITPCFQNSKAAVIKNLPNGFGAGTTELYVLRALNGIFPEFIYSFIKTSDFLIKGEKIMRGVAGQQRVPRDYVENHLIPLPPLSEQKRIVAKLDELMAYCDSLEESIKNSQKQNALLLSQILREALEPKEKVT